MKKERDTKMVSVRMQKDLLKRIERFAQGEQRTLSNAIIVLLKRVLDRDAA